MKKVFFAALVICCTVLNTVAQAAVQRDMQNKYTISFDINDYSVKEYNGLIAINTSTAPVYYATDPALPAIPYTSQRIIRPARVKGFDYKITFEKVLVSDRHLQGQEQGKAGLFAAHFGLQAAAVTTRRIVLL